MPDGLETRLLHAGRWPASAGEVVTPIFQSATFATDPSEPPRYIRLNNTPNHQVLAQRLAAVTGAERAVVAASGMAAITTSLLALLKAGDHLIAQDCLYGGVTAFLRGLAPQHGIEVDFVPPDDPAAWAEALRPKTRAIYVETLSNPLVRPADLPAVVDFARRHGLTSIVDNTFASPVNLRPVELGFDLELHSATKYLNGHSDIVAGLIAGRAELVERIEGALGVLGGSLDPNSAFLLERGLKTLCLRVTQQNENAQAIAELLAEHPAVRRVHYPSLLASPPSHLAGYGGVLAFEPHGGVGRADEIIRRLRLFYPAPSLGGVESLVTRPVATSHRKVSAEDRAAAGICEELIRLSVGIETQADLLEDLKGALD